jgi:hypothetical protein
MSKPFRPRSIFRSRRRRPPVYMEAVETAASKARLKPGTLTEARVWHRADCPRPRGSECICNPHEIDVEMIDRTPDVLSN